LLDAGSTVLRLNRFLFSNILVQAAILNQQEIAVENKIFRQLFL